MSTHRKCSRVPLDIYLNKFVAGVPYMTRTSDISSEGLGLVKLLEPQQEGKRVGLQFQLPGSEEVIYAEGEVVREWLDDKQHEEGSGVRFTNMTERHRRLVEKFVEGNSSH
jgi:c-di-GMP-binding flagellar brake protein YcgR